MSRWFLGTMGFSYADWARAFYPPGLKPGEWLGYYATQFNAVELDTTFHAAPDAGRVRRWAAVTPAGFRFCVKTPRAVTHDSPIERSGPAMAAFLDVCRHFEQKLAVVLIQFPPGFRADRADALQRFLDGLQAGADCPRYAVEFRDITWRTPATADLLAARGICWVAGDYVGRPEPIVPTADFLYIRWIGEHDRFDYLAAEQIDPTDRLLWWKSQLLACPGVADIYGFFNNDYAGYSVATCRRFEAMMGLDTRPRGATAPGQQMLF